MTKSVARFIRTIPDFPTKGIMFRDVTTLFGDPEGMRLTIQQILETVDDLQIDKVAGIEARGFILGGAIAHQMGIGFIPVRKKGKLPWKTISEDYELEYGTETVELHQDAAQPGEKILLVDDLIATGGTAAAGIKLIERLGAEVVHCAFVVDLPELGGMKRIKSLGVPATALCTFEGA